jgi:hypothetical protein
MKRGKKTLRLTNIPSFRQEKKRMSIFDTPEATKRLLRKKSSLFLSKIKSSFHANKKNAQTAF